MSRRRSGATLTSDPARKTGRRQAAKSEDQVTALSGQHHAVLAVALEYASKGWEVFPLKGKVPYTAHGHLDASSDPAMVRRWWRHWPMANIGARVPGRLLVLDIDPRNGGDLDALGDLPPTRTCRSGRGDGGRHLYFLRPEGVLTRTRLPVGIDVKNGGYVVVPPSVHPATGEPYRWVDPEHPIAPLPDHLRDLLTAPDLALRRPQGYERGSGGVSTAGTMKAALVGLVQVVLDAEPGNRNSALHWAACRLAEHVREGRIGDSAARVLMLRAGEWAGLDADEVRMTVASAFTHRTALVVVRDV